MKYMILVINPGSTSTKFAVYSDQEELLMETIRHSIEELKEFKTIGEQYAFRSQLIRNSLEKAGIELTSFSAIIGRGGLLKPIPGGVWAVNEEMIQDLKAGISGEHASNLGGVMAARVGDLSNAPAYIADPVVVDELCEEARLSGHKALPRRSIFHALNQKASARKAAQALGKRYEKCKLIIAHLGGGISIGAHKNGQVVDVNNALNGEGPFSPERSGTLPAGQVVELCFSGEKTQAEVMRMLTGEGGLVSYLGNNNGKELVDRAEAGDEEAGLVLRAMIYQIAKEIAALSAAFNGDLDAIVLTGGLAYNKTIVEGIKTRVAFLSQVLIFPGENEMTALRDAALRALKGEERIREYKN